MNFDVIDIKREQLRYSVTDFCKEAGIDRTTYYKIMQNPDSIKLSTLTKMVKVLKLTQAEMKQLLT